MAALAGCALVASYLCSWAIAYGASVVGFSGASHDHEIDGQITLRVARQSDILSIQNCNVASLSENYGSSMYMNHIRKWPELVLVAEHFPKNSSTLMERSLLPNELCSYKESEENQLDGGRIVGYVLGKVSPRFVGDRPRSPSKYHLGDENSATDVDGHIVSLAVLRGFRRLGLASQLLNQIHFHMRECYHVAAAVLYVRVSNSIAVSLYVGKMGYERERVVKNYYPDGEDAFVMRKNLLILDEEWLIFFGCQSTEAGNFKESTTSTSPTSSPFRRIRNQVSRSNGLKWGNPMSLPRTIVW